jgi:hypothetical protein
MSDLSLVSMDDIWDEIKKRFDCVLLVDLKSIDSNREGAQVSFHGGKFACIGLAQYAVSKIMRDSLGPSTCKGEV